MSPSDDPPKNDPRAFAEAWLREQRAFWQVFRDNQDPSGYQQAQDAWSVACERWWAAVADNAPPTLRPALNAALDHTRLCLRMALEMADSGDATAVFEWMTSPERLLEAAASAAGAGTAPGDPAHDAAQLAAIARAAEFLSRIAQAALGDVRARVETEPPETPSDLLAIYVEAFEGRYRDEARSDEFARLAGELVNTWVAAEASRRAQAP